MVCVSQNASIKICLSGIFPFPCDFPPPKETWLGPECSSSVLLSEGGDAAASGADYQRDMLRCPAGIRGSRGPASAWLGHTHGSQEEGSRPSQVLVSQAKRLCDPPAHTVEHIPVTPNHPCIITHTHPHRHTLLTITAQTAR